MQNIKHATDMKVDSAAKDLHILELTQQIGELQVKVLEATGPKINVSMRVKDGVDKEPKEDLVETEVIPFTEARRKRAPRCKSNNA